jgi:plastocyanin
MAMKRASLLRASAAGLLGAGLMAGFLWLQNGCVNSNSGYSTMGPSAQPTATPGGPTLTPTPIVITAAGTSFSRASVSVATGTSITFNTPGHTVDIDDGLSDGLCGGHDFTSFPASFQFVGTSGAVYHIHCDIHSSCGAGNCSGCTGMVMTVNIL